MRNFEARNLDTALISAAEKVSGHIAALLRHADERQGLKSLFEFGGATDAWGSAA